MKIEMLTRKQISERLVHKAFLFSLKWTTDDFIKAFFKEILKELKSGNKVEIEGFGKFEAVKKKARKGVKPPTGEPILIPACRVPKFSPYPSAKKAIQEEEENTNQV